MVFEVFDKRKDPALILVVFGKTKSREIRKSVDVMDITAEVTLPFKGTRPFLESKPGLPLEPEIGLPEGFRKNI